MGDIFFSVKQTKSLRKSDHKSSDLPAQMDGHKWWIMEITSSPRRCLVLWICSIHSHLIQCASLWPWWQASIQNKSGNHLKTVHQRARQRLLFHSCKEIHDNPNNENSPQSTYCVPSLLGAIRYSSCTFPPFSHLLVTCPGSWWCDGPMLRSEAPLRLPQAHQRIFSRWHVGLQSAKSGGCLATGPQYWGQTTQQQQTSFLLYPPTPQKMEDMLRNLVITFFL